MRMSRRFLLILAGVGVLAGILWIAARSYLRSQHAAEQVAARLSAVYGGPVCLDRVDVGAQKSTLHGLRLYEPGSDESSPPWLSFDHVETDVSVWNLLTGNTEPGQLTVAGAKVFLRFDKRGGLLTRLPKTESGWRHLPNLDVERGQITIDQEGRPEMVVEGVSLKLAAEGDHLSLSGDVKDPKWGNWTLSGSLAADAQAGTATLKTGMSHITQAMLDDLPLISPTVWEEVQVEGDSPVEVGVRFNRAENMVHYHVALEPEHTRVHVPAIELAARDAQGRVTIDDGVVRLRDVRGQAADGTVALSGDLDFAREPARLNFAVQVGRLDVSQLPKSWSLPSQVSGRLTGQANLQVLLVDSHAQTSGTGQGVIQDARIAGQPAEPIRLDLHAVGNGYRFASRQPVHGKQPAVGLAVATGLMAPPEKPNDEVLNEVFYFPTRVADWALTSTLSGVEAFTRATQEVVGYFHKAAGAPQKPDQPPRYLEANLAMKDVDLEKFVQGLGLQLPFQVAGRLTFDVHAAIPIDTPRDLKTYRLNGNAALAWFSLNELKLANVRARVVFNNGILQLEEFHGEVPEGQPDQAEPGSFDGSARVQLAPQGDLSAQLALRKIPLDQVLSLVPGAAEQVEGRLTGTASFLAPVAQLRDVRTWQASGAISTKQGKAFGLPLDTAVADFRLQRGILELTKGRARLEGAPVNATATLALTSPFRYQGDSNVQGADLTALRHLSPKLRPPVALAGSLNTTADFQGTVSPWTFQGSGNVTAAGLSVDTLKVRDLRLHWDSDARRLAISKVQAVFYGGEVTGDGVLPLRPTAAAKVDLRLKNVDVGLLQKDVPAIPFRLEGKAGGTVEGGLNTPGPTGQRAFTGTIDLQSPQLRVQGIPTERLHGTVNYQQGTANYRLEGDALGGNFQLTGQLPPEAAPPAPQPTEKQGRLHIQGVRLARLGRALGIPEALRPLGGVFNLDFTYHHEGTDWQPVGEGRFTLERPRWGTTELAPAVQGKLQLSRTDLRLTELEGELGGGGLRGQAGFDFQRTDRRWFNLALDGGEAAQLLAPWPELSSRIAGMVSVSLRGTLGRAWWGTGQVALLNGRIADVSVAEWRLPLEIVYVPARHWGQMSIRDSTAVLAQGRALGQASWTWGMESRLEGRVRFYGVHVQALLRQLTDSGQIGQGQMTGQMEFSGNNVRSMDDVTAELDATLRQTQALTLPVLYQLTPYLAPGQSSSATFASGSLRGRLRGGVFRVQRLTLDGRTLKFILEGTATLQGRLDLDVTATSGQLGVNPNALRVLTRAASYLSNRLIHLRVTGTYRNPSIRIEPASLLTQEAVLFFLNRAVAPVP